MSVDCKGCSASTSNARAGDVCRNGFIQGNYPKHATPPCLRDNLPDHWVNNDGSPRFYCLHDTSSGEGGQ